MVNVKLTRGRNFAPSNFDLTFCSLKTTIEFNETQADRNLSQLGGRLKDRRARTVIASRLMRLGEGLLGDAPNVGDGVRELRIHYGPGYRIYFVQRGTTLIILLCGGDKGSQQRDINTAKTLALNWEQEND